HTWVAARQIVRVIRQQHTNLCFVIQPGRSYLVVITGQWRAANDFILLRRIDYGSAACSIHKRQRHVRRAGPVSCIAIVPVDNETFKRRKRSSLPGRVLAGRRPSADAAVIRAVRERSASGLSSIATIGSGWDH